MSLYISTRNQFPFLFLYIVLSIYIPPSYFQFPLPFIAKDSNLTSKNPPPNNINTHSIAAYYERTQHKDLVKIPKISRHRMKLKEEKKKKKKKVKLPFLFLLSSVLRGKHNFCQDTKSFLFPMSCKIKNMCIYIFYSIASYVYIYTY